MTEAGNVGGLNFTGGTFTASAINGFAGGNGSLAVVNFGAGNPPVFQLTLSR